MSGSFSKTFLALAWHLDNWCRQKMRVGEAGDFPCPDSLQECLNGAASRLSADSLEEVGVFLWMLCVHIDGPHQ